jgi:hypothetical protein
MLPFEKLDKLELECLPTLPLGSGRNIIGCVERSIFNFTSDFKFWLTNGE